jgi:hypothetical protein
MLIAAEIDISSQQTSQLVIFIETGQYLAVNLFTASPFHDRTNSCGALNNFSSLRRDSGF